MVAGESVETRVTSILGLVLCFLVASSGVAQAAEGEEALDLEERLFLEFTDYEYCHGIEDVIEQCEEPRDGAMCTWLRVLGMDLDSQFTTLCFI